MNANLPSVFKFKTCEDLVRLGRSNDGGYLISLSDIEKSEFLISLGICDDWSFEQDFISRTKVPVMAYDASINWKFWLKRSIIEILKNPFSFYPLVKFNSYKKFFRNERKHIMKYVGSRTEDNLQISLNDVLDNISSDNIFLKIDIEGSEYRLLKDLVENCHRLTGLVIEFHDVDLHLDRIKDFLREFSLNIVHIHINNYSQVLCENKTPTFIEITFSKYARLNIEPVLPHPLDMPNNKRETEIKLVINENEK